MARRQYRSAREGSAPGAAIRSLRIEELLREELVFLTDNVLSDERLSGMKVTRVELSRDGSRARVWFIVEPAPTPELAAEIERVLQRATGFLRSTLCDALPLKRMPELRFR